MTTNKCQKVLIAAAMINGGSYPKSCPICGLGPCRQIGNNDDNQNFVITETKPETNN